MQFRRATLSDADQCSFVLCESIRVLCEKDHHSDETTVEQWVGNKRPEDLAQWIESDELVIYVVELDGNVVAVGGIQLPNEISLLYVAPEHRNTGVSRFLLTKLESEMATKMVELAVLVSTETAHEFYITHNWTDRGNPELWLGMAGYPMEKQLLPAGKV